MVGGAIVSEGLKVANCFNWGVKSAYFFYYGSILYNTTVDTKTVLYGGLIAYILYSLCALFSIFSRIFLRAVKFNLKTLLTSKSLLFAKSFIPFVSGVAIVWGVFWTNHWFNLKYGKCLTTGQCDNVDVLLVLYSKVTQWYPTLSQSHVLLSGILLHVFAGRIRELFEDFDPYDDEDDSSYGKTVYKPVTSEQLRIVVCEKIAERLAMLRNRNKNNQV